jgi:hypothetical protein
MLTHATSPRETMTDQTHLPGSTSGIVSGRGGRGQRSRALPEALGIAALALLVRLVGITREPAGDELYHILSARQYLTDGVPGINGGIYDRVPLFTSMVAGAYRLLGESMFAARLPALVGGVLLALVVFLWLRREHSRAAAWIAGGLLALDPLMVELSQYSRFYTLQLFCFALAAVAAYEATRPRAGTGRRFASGAGALLALLGAVYFQAVSIVGGGGIALFVALLVGGTLIGRLPAPRRLPVALGAGAAAAVLVALVLASPVGAMMIRMATYTDTWAASTASTPQYYHWLLQGSYPLLWALFPLVAAAALAARWRPALLCLCIFVVAFTAHSLMAWKSPRYFAYALPFFFALAGIALAETVPAMARWLARAARRLPLLAAAPGVRRTALAAVALGLAAFAVANTPALMRTIEGLRRDHRFLYPGGPTPTLSWRLAAPTLRPIVDSVEAVVSTEDLEAFYFLGRASFVLDRDHLNQGSRLPEFSVDPRIRTPMVSERGSLERIVACNPSGVVVAMRWALRASYKMPRETAEFIESRLTPVPLPRESGLVAYRWESPATDAAACSGLALQPAAPAPAAPGPR